MDRTQRTEPAVRRRRAAQPHEDAGGAGTERVVDELADARRTRRHGVVAISATHERETARTRHLDDRGAAVQSPCRLHRIPERPGHDRVAIGAAEHVEQPVTAVREGGFVAVVSEVPARSTDGSGDIGRGGGAAELVDGCEDAHRPATLLRAMPDGIPDRAGKVSPCP